MFFLHSSGCLLHFRGLAGVELTQELEFTGNSKTSRDTFLLLLTSTKMQVCTCTVAYDSWYGIMLPSVENPWLCLEIARILVYPRYKKKNGMEGKFIHFIQILNCEPATSAGRTATRCLAQLSCCRSSERVLGCLLGWLQQWQQGTCQSCRNGLNIQPLVQPHFFHYCARHCHVMNTWHVNIRPHLCMGLLIYKWDPRI